MKITLPTTHSCAQELDLMARRLFAARQAMTTGSATAKDRALAQALTVNETQYGGHSVKYDFDCGCASTNDAIRAYDVLRSEFPEVLKLYLMAAGGRHGRFTVEVGTLKQGDDVEYSAHELVELLPRLLSNFRGEQV